MTRTCPTCSRECAETEQWCQRCRTHLESSDDAPAEGGGRLFGRVGAVLVMLFLGALMAAISRAGERDAAVPADAPAARRAPPRAVRAPRTEKETFVDDFRVACLRRGNDEAFCRCAGERLYERIPLGELDSALEAIKNGRPDPRIGEIIVQCSN